MPYTQLSTIAVPGMRYVWYPKKTLLDLEHLTIDDFSNQRTFKKMTEFRAIDNLSDLRTLK